MSEEAAGNQAEWGERTGGALIDLTIMIVIIGAGTVIGTILLASGGWRIALGIWIILAGVVGSIVYAPVMVARSGNGNGLTMGKRAVGVRAVRDDGRPIGFWLGMLREFVVPIVFGILLTGGLFWLVDALWPLVDSRNRAVHDIVSGTHVVKLEG
jgi:uncharacterized RDD family membrane protein YckC